MKRHSNPQGLYPIPPGPQAPLHTQENMFLTSQNTWAASASSGSSRAATGGAMVDPAALLGKLPGTGGGAGGLDLRSLAVTNGMGQALLRQQLAALMGVGQQSLDSAGEASLSATSEDLTGNLMVNKMLMNLNIPSTQFANAMNFQTLSEQNHQGMESQANGVYDEEDDLESGTLPDDETIAHTSFDRSADLVEQQQAQQQSSLMDKFKQLREWQQRQQEMLMMQQQQQLELLRDEQERVQRMVAKQRQMQWGAPPNPKNGFASTLSEGLMTPQQFSSPRPAQRPLTHTHGHQGRRAQPHNTALVQNGRPVPILPTQNSPRRPAENESDLDVESDACSQHSLLEEEGVYPLTDQGSSTAEDVPRAIGPGDRLSHQGFSGPPHYQPTRVGQRTHTGFRNNVDIGSPYVEDHIEEAGDSGGEENSHMDYNHNHDGLDFREGGEYSEQYGRSPTQGNSYRTNTQYGDSEESETEDVYDENEDECQCAHNETEFDEIPVSGLGEKKKTFEELLEEELRKEEERMKQQSQTSSGKSSSSKKQFLRKGEGLARFTDSGSAERRKPRSRSKNRAQGTGSNSKPAQAEKTSSGSGSSSSGGRSSAPVSRPTSARMNNTPVTRGLPPKGTGVNRKVFTKDSEPKQATQQEKAQQAKINREKTSLQEKTTVKPKNSAQRQQPTQQPTQQPQKPVPKLQLKPPSAPKPVDPCDTPGKCSDVSSLGETSFQARLTARAEMEVVEVEDLEEFELLEQYADDNASFMSNISAVNRVVQENKGVQRNHKMPPLSNIIKRPPVTHTPPRPRPAPQAESSSEDDTEDATSVSSEFDDNSSQSQPGEGEKPPKQGDQSGDEDHDTTLVETADTVIPQTTTVPAQTDSPPRPPMQRKIASRDQNKASRQDDGPRAPGPSALTNLLASVQQFSDSDPELAKNHSDEVSEDETDESEGPTYDNACNKDQSGGMLQELSQKDVDVRDRRKSEETTQLSHVQRQPSPGYTAMPNDNHSAGDQNSHQDADPVVQQMAFDDDEAWDTSTVEEPSSSASGRTDGNPIIRKSILSRNNGAGDSSTERSTPPTSQLVSKLFPKLRQEKPKPKPEPVAEQRLAAAGQAKLAEGVQSKLLRDKLAELEQEIERFRTENSNLGKLRKEREEGLAQLNKEMSEFEKQKNEELKRLQEFKSEEMKKLKREKKQFEQYQATSRAMPNKKEREEIEMLKTQLSELQDEVKRKEARWTSSMARLREKSESLMAENTELKEEIKLLEKQRLQTWQQREHAPKVREETLRAPAIKKSTHQPTKSPKPEAQPCRQASRDSALGMSANLDLDESDLRAAEDTPRPTGTSGGSPRTPDVAFTPTPFTTRHSFSPPKNSAVSAETKKPLPRKRATPLSISQVIDKGNEEYEEVQHPDGKMEKLYTNGAREILFANGTRKQVSAGGQSIIVSFCNGDLKQILPDQRVVYYYADAQITHTTYPDGLEILQFPNQQIEKHYPDGTKEITFPEQTIKYLFPNGTEEIIYSDGTVTRVEKNGQKTVEFPNGQREVHTEHYRRREYPDGTVKTVFPDGKQETRYSSGRVRVRDNEGNLIVDKRI